VYRVQLGAFKDKKSKEIFRDAPDVIQVITEDGLYKYLTGSFSNLEAAKKHREAMAKLGYKGAFIVPYKDGKRVTLESLGEK